MKINMQFALRYNGHRLYTGYVGENMWRRVIYTNQETIYGRLIHRALNILYPNSNILNDEVCDDQRFYDWKDT